MVDPLGPMDGCGVTRPHLLPASRRGVPGAGRIRRHTPGLWPFHDVGAGRPGARNRAPAGRRVAGSPAARHSAASHRRDVRLCQPREPGDGQPGSRPVRARLCGPAGQRRGGAGAGRDLPGLRRQCQPGQPALDFIGPPAAQHGLDAGGARLSPPAARLSARFRPPDARQLRPQARHRSRPGARPPAWDSCWPWPP